MVGSRRCLLGVAVRDVAPGSPPRARTSTIGATCAEACKGADAVGAGTVPLTRSRLSASGRKARVARFAPCGMAAACARGQRATPCLVIILGVGRETFHTTSLGRADDARSAAVRVARKLRGVVSGVPSAPCGSGGGASRLVGAPSGALGPRMLACALRYCFLARSCAGGTESPPSPSAERPFRDDAPDDTRLGPWAGGLEAPCRTHADFGRSRRHQHELGRAWPAFGLPQPGFGRCRPRQVEFSRMLVTSCLDLVDPGPRIVELSPNLAKPGPCQNKLAEHGHSWPKTQSNLPRMW